jgi:hypothetical protein
MALHTHYGPGGYDPSKPNNNVLFETEIDDAGPSAEQAARESAVAKLQALGLTETEALALVGGTP